MMRPISPIRSFVVLGNLSLAAVGALANAQTTLASDACANQQPVKDAWIDTRLETVYLFNPHLNNFSIKTDVDGGAVLLTGTVRSEIDKDLAEEIAKSLKGVTSVESHLVVRESVRRNELADDDREFSGRVSDAMMTASVKTQLAANKNVSASSINVDTQNHAVKLSGQVNTHAEKQLAGYISKNTPGVDSVSNELKVTASADNT